ncbi:acetyl-CoA carboxylase biotin carboxyl carrier protein subunit [Anaerocolumna cellulosilytica]|uniref:Biotin carboxyl carrier protein of acetyl-CoA carboxylase n=1 Tax=Anaerocolumna cellulosilytica TaxID=433286 RepID=A0A6S6QY29_9FIRM|nr:biotin/lipoyl-containing protein [Anaerocolumna cellulosilytica]MBB5195050.1 acetyl-CoA carboxylase biotin carboxyl carrier protein [Anaerocolumna cellulosilytica]BCJ96113.1 acetyl-CoA carboxylase biotin carboxyl carrier protein subunit [Anaerocolumna cellulosilytica]
MEFENIIKLIKTVSESNLTSFTYAEGDLSLSFQKEHGALSTVAGSIPITSSVTKEEAVEEETHKFSIKSPMVGTFYSAKTEGGEPYISIGDKVKKGQVIGIVEAMKLMNEIESSYDGIVEEILVENKNMVEYGQPLVHIRPL